MLTSDLFNGIVSLTRQLSETARPPTWVEIDEVVTTPSTKLFVATEGTGVVGMLTLILVRIPTGLRGHIEDVVVSSTHRNQGVGERLSRAALQAAESKGARTVDLTSRPSREAANRLYQRLGFVPRSTSVYRYSFGG